MTVVHSGQTYVHSAAVIVGEQVVSVGHGREGENGHVTPNDAVKPGDLVYVKDPFGIGELFTLFVFIVLNVETIRTTIQYLHLPCDSADADEGPDEGHRWLLVLAFGHVRQMTPVGWAVDRPYVRMPRLQHRIGQELIGDTLVCTLRWQRRRQQAWL